MRLTSKQIVKNIENDLISFFEFKYQRYKMEPDAFYIALVKTKLEYNGKDISNYRLIFDPIENIEYGLKGSVKIRLFPLYNSTESKMIKIEWNYE